MATRAELIALMRECDYARYVPPGDGGKALRTLRAVVVADRDAAHVLIGTMEGCERTVRRHQQYLRDALT